MPKDHYKREFRWSKLNATYRKELLETFKLTLSICCDGLLAIKTNALIDRRGKIENIFTNLIEGCFSGYEIDPKQKSLRPNLKKKFFEIVNRVQIHCDADFRPLTPDEVVRLLVQTLAKRDGGQFDEYIPLFANLRSHESKPTQVVDIVAGMVKTVIETGDFRESLQPLPFDMRKMKEYSDNLPKAYFCFA